ncbi:3-hydroxyacyl-CoA dehydrogenase/enoyl-CoA hydratase family protein [Halohasta salina]|uniref:3-hydroxyacyl-CoA dehydrogenase/enoyl-CoA hydratase family protein n=1 Tax=Halohasta salina TaxID=2961621 RepID=UPI0020A435BC|nr:3-hydroxyacyl-CoA dehydrogenase/enoyl-CoA hydratase family protein [Halohasta salina]
MDVADVTTVSVLGAGNMGHGIAEVAALAGYDVRLRDINDDLVQEGYDAIEWSLEKFVDANRLTPEEADAARNRIEPVVEMEAAVADADVIIEVVPEVMDVKRDVFGEVAEHAPEDAVFATNTSSLSITELSTATDRPEQFCGMHFFNPPVRMELVEVIAGDHTSEETLAVVEALAKSMDKTPVRVRTDRPGFIVNRVLIPLLNEAAWLVEEETATIAEVDATATFDMGLPMGAFELADQIGIDVCYHVLDHLQSAVGDAYRPCPLLAAKVQADAIGRKAGEGFYDYEDGGVDIPADAGRRAVADRLLAVMANEVAGLIEGGVAEAAAIDRAMQLGAGFPEGPAAMADDRGLEPLVAVLDGRLASTDEPRYEPVDHLRELAAADRGFYPAGDDEDVMAFDTIRVDREGRIGQIVLNRPERMNTISTELLDELAAAVEEFDADSEIRCLLLSGAGDRAFSAGADVSGLGEDPDALDATAFSRTGQQTFGKLEACETPVVASVDGYCLGGGMELAAAADLRIASERAEFGQPEHTLGLLPGWGGTQRLGHLIGESRAKEIIFTADRFDAGTMVDYGFLTEAVAADDLDDAAMALAEKLAAGPPIAQRFTKRAMLAGRDDIEAGLEIEAQAFGLLATTEDLREGLRAFAEDDEPTFTGE